MDLNEISRQQLSKLRELGIEFLVSELGVTREEAERRYDDQLRKDLVEKESKYTKFKQEHSARAAELEQACADEIRRVAYQGNISIESATAMVVPRTYAAERNGRQKLAKSEKRLAEINLRPGASK